MQAKTNAQEEELIAMKVKVFEDEASAVLSTKVTDYVGWFIKYGLETSLQGVPRSCQLDSLLTILQRHPNALQSLFGNEKVVCGLLQRSRQLFDLAFIHEQYTAACPTGKDSSQVVVRLDRGFGELIDRAQDPLILLFTQSLHLFISMKMAFPKQTSALLGPAFRKQAAQVPRVWEFVLRPLFQKKNLKRHFAKLHGLCTWLVLMGDRNDLVFDLGKKINSFLIYDKSQNSIEMIGVCNILFDLLATRFPRETTLRHHGLAALIARLDPLRLTYFLEIWLEARRNFLQTIDFSHFFRTLGGLGASKAVVELLGKIWNIMLGLRRYSILLHLFSGYVRREFTKLALSSTDDLQLYLKIIKQFMIGLSNRERFQGQQVDELTGNLTRHALRKGISLSSCYKHILEIYSTYQHRFSCLSDTSKRFYNQVQALAKIRMQPAQVHAVYEQYAIRELGYQEEVNEEWQSLRKTSQRYRGLENLGNTCYFNSFMQALYMTKKFRLLVNAYAEDGALPSSKAKLYALQYLFEELARKETEVLQPLKPDYFRSELPQPFKSAPYQQDAAEFGRVYLQGLAAELEGNHLQRLERLLMQRLKKVIRCQKCNSAKQQLECIFDLILTLEKGQPSICLSRLISNYFSPVSFTHQDRLDCSKCKQRTDAITQLLPHRLSDILILTLSIFEYVGEGKKILLPLTFEFTLNLSALLSAPQLGEYQLYAFIVHMGSLPSSGHYVCYARNLEENPMLWYHLNDGYVEELQITKPEDFNFGQNQTPYMLFYSKKPLTSSKIVSK